MAEQDRALRIRKLADRSVGTRIPMAHPTTGETELYDPDTESFLPWPLAGVKIEGDPPAECGIPTSFVNRGRGEGWVVLEGRRPVHRPGGPPGNEWVPTHTFMHADVIVIKTVDGDVRYRVTHQPDKYADNGNGQWDDDTPVTDEIYNNGQTRVDWFYRVTLEA